MGPLPPVVSFVYEILQGATPPEIPPPEPAPSESGPRRARSQVKGGQRHNPVRVRRKKAGLRSSSEADWDQTLVRFRGDLDDFYSVHHGQPSGGLLPETALAKINKFIKEDLKRSVSNFYCVFVHHFTNLTTWQQPLRCAKAGEGERSRDTEIYLEGLLEAIHRVNPSPIPATGESDEENTTIDLLSRRKHSFASVGSDLVANLIL